MLRGSPPMKASKSLSLFGTMFGHRISRDNTCSPEPFSASSSKCYFIPLTAHLLWENTDSVLSNQRIRPTAPIRPFEFNDEVHRYSMSACDSFHVRLTTSPIQQSIRIGKFLWLHPICFSGVWKSDIALLNSLPEQSKISLIIQFLFRGFDAFSKYARYVRWDSI
ncbi:hypothetical protein Tco_0116338 [Tanacetum coccineum]